MNRISLLCLAYFHLKIKLVRLSFTICNLSFCVLFSCAYSLVTRTGCLYCEIDVYYTYA